MNLLDHRRIPKVRIHLMFTTVGNRGIMHLGLCLRVLILVALTVPIRAAQPAQETFTLTVPDGPTSTLSGSSVSLLCQVSSLFNVEPLEVRWYRSGDFDKPALLYEDHKIQEAPVDPRYRGRVSLTGGLERGNVSLTLERVTLEDMGEYVCHVSNAQWYEKASVFLTVKVLGGTPVVSVAEARGGGGQVNVTCLSEGWSPYPTLTWRNKEGTEIRNGREVLNTPDPQGLVRISSWMLCSPSDTDWLSCTVSLSEEEKKESRILPKAPTEVKGPEEVICRYHNVLKTSKKVCTMSGTFHSNNVDKGTIAATALISKLQKVDQKIYSILVFDQLM